MSTAIALFSQSRTWAHWSEVSASVGKFILKAFLSSAFELIP